MQLQNRNKMKNLKIVEKKLGKGLIPDTKDERDLKYSDVLGAGPVMTEEEWRQGFDIEKELNIKIPFKNQCSSLSCVGQGFSYQTAVINAKEVGRYDEASAKAIYSQIFLPGGGAHLRDAAKLLVNWGALLETQLKSYKSDGTTDEKFITDLSWLNPELSQLAKVLQAKEYRTMSGLGIDYFARAIKDNLGCVGGVAGANNGTWSSNEPKPPINIKAISWYHCLYFGKFGIDEKGKYIATPNSWGTRNSADALHPDDWQKIREDYFKDNNYFIINPWTLIDKPNEPNKPINKITMVMIKKVGAAAVYAQVGDTLIPFATTWDEYLAEYPTAKIIELSAAEFSKYRIAATLGIKKK